MRNRIKYYILIILFIFSNCFYLANASVKIKLAIFDDPKPDPTRNQSSQQFLNSYLAGVNTAIVVAASKGIIITEKDFFHQNNFSSIIQQATNVKSWQPDVIMGLSTSNDFLMSKAFFSDQLILSISATDSELKTLPKNFYSLGIPDTDAVKTIIKFATNHFPNSNLFITAAAESKESVDFACLLANDYKKQFPNKSAIIHKFLTEDMDHLILSKLMSDYHKKDIIVIMAIGYDSAIELMNKISDYLKPNNPIFLTSTDNWGNNTTPDNMVGNYDAFRIDTLSGGDDTYDYKIFLDNFKKLYHSSPNDKISYVTYRTIMSFVDAKLMYSDNNKKNNKNTVLSAYLNALKYHPDWYRPPYYVVYMLKNQKEIFFEKIH